MTAAPRADRTTVLAPGQRLGGKLTLLRHLGQGGMGAVWLAKNLATEAQIALKILQPNHGVDEQAAERFRHEATLGAVLVHRNITRVFDLVEEEDGTLVLVMELLRGESLEAYLAARGALTTREATAIVVPILSALQHAHERGVIHRDLKPSNIFLHVDPDGHVTPKLLDFGIAKVHDSNVHTRAGDALGTPSYMSPEQVRASKQLDGRSDLFSAGVVLYELMTGENPFYAPTSSGALAHVLELEVDPDPRIEPRVWLEVERALSKQAYERHGSAGELSAALCAALGENAAALADSLRRDAPPASAPEEPMTPASPEQARSLRPAALPTGSTTAVTAKIPMRSSRALLAALGLVVLLASAGGVLLLLRPAESRPPPRATPAVTAAPAPEIPEPPSTATSTGDVPSPEMPLREPLPPATSQAGTSRTAAPRHGPRHPATAPTTTTRAIGRKPGF